MSELNHRVEALPRLDPLLIDPVNLLISAALAWPACHRIETLGELIGADADALVSGIFQLAAARRAESHPGGDAGAWVWLTEEGRDRLVAHLRAFRALLEKVDGLLPES